MSMPYPMWMQIYFSITAGGGVPGKVAGTVPVTTTGVGVITGMLRLFTGTFLPDGEMITAITGGEDMNGNTGEYHIKTLGAIGAAGKETGTGKGSIPGVLKDYRQEIKREWSILLDRKADLALASDLIPDLEDPNN